MKNAFKVSVKTAVTVLVAAFAMVGCGKNSDNTNPAIVGPYGFGSCAGCVGTTQVFAQGTSQNTQLGEALQLQFFGTSGATYQQYTSSQYSQVAAQGILYIGQMATQCGLPPGQYQVTTSGSPAVMSGNSIQSMQMVGSGPNQVMIQFTRIYFTTPSTFQADGVMYGPGAMTQCQFHYY
jgi:hypothetical protein